MAIAVLLVAAGALWLLGTAKTDRAARAFRERVSRRGHPEPAPRLENAIGRLRAWSEANDRSLFGRLRPGLTDEQVRAKLRAAGMECPEEVRALYRWADGGSGRLLPAFQFVSLDEALETRSSLGSGVALLGDEELTWGKAFLPIVHFTPAGDEFYVALCDGEAHPNAPVAQFSFEDGRTIAEYPSLAAFLSEVAELYETGAFQLDRHGQLTSDERLVRRVEDRFPSYHPVSRPPLPPLEQKPPVEQPLPEGGKRITRQDSLGLSWDEDYDAAGRLQRKSRVQHGREERFEYSYDGEGRLREERHLQFLQGKPADWQPGRRVLRVTHQYRDDGTVLVESRFDDEPPFATSRVQPKADGGVLVLERLGEW
jgi:YD repeat-containing protein